MPRKVNAEQFARHHPRLARTIERMGWAREAKLPTGVDAIAIVGDRYVASQEHGEILSSERTPATITSAVAKAIPVYSIKRILQTGRGSPRVHR